MKSCVQLFKHPGIEFLVRHEDVYRFVRANKDIPIGALLFVEVMAKRKKLDDLVYLLREDHQFFASLYPRTETAINLCVEQLLEKYNSGRLERWMKKARSFRFVLVQRLRVTCSQRNLGTCWETISIHSTTAVKATVLLFSTPRDRLFMCSV
jgi:hypothetical protein